MAVLILKKWHPDCGSYRDAGYWRLLYGDKWEVDTGMSAIVI